MANWRAEQYQEIFFYNAEWTKSIDKKFIEILVEEARKGNVSHGEGAFHAILMARGVVNDTFGTEFNYNVCQTQFEKLRRRYNIFKIILDTVGVVWDRENNIVHALPCHWDVWCKEMELSKAYLYRGDPDYDELKTIFKEKFDREAWGSKQTVINIFSDTDNVNNMQHNALIDLTSNEDEVQSNVIIVSSDDENYAPPSDVGSSNVPVAVYNFGPFAIENFANFHSKKSDRKGKSKVRASN